MIGVLRIVGLLNVAVWLGASVFFTLAVGPAFFSESMLRLLGRPHAGAAAQLVLERYFIMHQICAGVALLHLVGEGVYLGRMIHRWTLGLLLVLLGFSLVAGYIIQPQLRSLHLTMYRPGLAVEEQETAGRSFRILHGVSQLINLAMLAGVLVYVVRLTKAPTETPRYRFQ
jgi:uncharacterized membrane protein YjgN (DUF898 family)